MGAQESTARLKQDSIEIGKDFDRSSDVYKVWTYVNPCTKNRRTKGTIFTKKWEDLSDSKKYIENGVKLLKKLRHPGVIMFLESTETSEQMSLMTEEIQVLDLCIDSLSFVEIHSGLCQILEALLFLHQKAGICHNSISPCTIFVAATGEWKLGGFELAQPVQFLTNDYLNSHFYKHTRSARFCPPSEMSSKQTGLERDAYAFGRLIDYVLSHLKAGESIEEELSHSLRDISEKLTNVETLEDLSSLRNSYVFSNDLTHITDFFGSIQIKSEPEKEAVFKTVVSRLRKLPVNVVAKRLCRLIMSRYVILEPMSHQYLYPSLLVPKDNTFDGILPPDLYKTYLIPEIVRVFAVKESSVRLGLLAHFDCYASYIPTNVLQGFVLEEIIKGIHDIDDRLVSASFRAMADLVDILGAARVCEWKLTKIFIDAKSTKTASKNKIKPPEPSPQFVEDQLPLPNIEVENTEETKYNPELSQAEWGEAEDNWNDDWDENQEADENENVSSIPVATKPPPTVPLSAPTALGTSSVTQIIVKNENKLGSSFEIKASKTIEDDLFAEMAPEIKTSGTLIDKLMALKEQEEAKSRKVVSSSKFAMTVDIDGADWGDDTAWEEEEEEIEKDSTHINEVIDEKVTGVTDRTRA